MANLTNASQQTPSSYQVQAAPSAPIPQKPLLTPQNANSLPAVASTGLSPTPPPPPAGNLLYWRDGTEPNFGIIALTGNDTITLAALPYADEQTTLVVKKDGNELASGGMTVAGQVITLATPCLGGEVFDIWYWSINPPGPTVLSTSIPPPPTGYYSYVLANYAPLSFYHMDEATTLLTDYGSNGFTFTGSSTGITFRTATIIPSESASFSRTSAGSDFYGSLGAQLITWSTSQSMTLLIPVNCSTPGASMGLIQQGNLTQGSGQGWGVYIDSTGHLNYFAYDSGFNFASSTGTIPSGTSFLIGITVNASAHTVDFYINGSNVGTTSAYTAGTSSSTIATATVFGGCNPTGAGINLFVGEMQGIAIIGTPLSSTDHANVYAAYL